MTEFLVVWFDAPLMSFGGTAVDAKGVTSDRPGASLLTGLLGNALGWEHRHVDELQALQARLVYGSRQDRRGERLVDYQTIDLGQAHLVGTGWTTRGVIEGRDGAFSEGTHIRHRHYLADAAYTVVLTLAEGEGPTLEALEEALRYPARPLFLGRKPCLPAAPLLPPQPRIQAAGVEDALRRAPARSGARGGLVWVPDDGGTGTLEVVCVDRDWRNQVHVGARSERMRRLEGP